MKKADYITLINELLEKCDKQSTFEFIYILLKKTV